MKTTRDPYRLGPAREGAPPTAEPLSGWAGDPVTAADLLAGQREQLTWLAGQEAGRRMSARQRAVSRARVQARVDLLRRIPAAATHLAETAPSELGTWTVWTVQGWLHYSLLTQLGAIGTVQPVSGRRLGTRPWSVEAAEAQTALVRAAATLCGVAFEADAVDRASGAAMLTVDEATGYTRRFLVPVPTGGDEPPVDRHLAVVS